MACSLGLVVKSHNEEHVPKSGIAVANHTSAIDSLVLSTRTCYDFTGQMQGGIIGFFMNMIGRASKHIWFNRHDDKGRANALQRMQDHANKPGLPPLLIFPEGVCVNNTAVLKFKRGAFQLDTPVYPIAMKFNMWYGDAFWWQPNFIHHLWSMMTSWAVVVDVWYLPPMTRNPEESAIAFADRVKARIAEQAGLENLAWDGYLKIMPPKPP